MCLLFQVCFALQSTRQIISWHAALIENDCFGVSNEP